MSQGIIVPEWILVKKPLTCGRQSMCPGWIYELPGGQQFSLKKTAVYKLFRVRFINQPAPLKNRGFFADFFLVVFQGKRPEKHPPQNPNTKIHSQYQGRGVLDSEGHWAKTCDCHVLQASSTQPNRTTRTCTCRHVSARSELTQSLANE